MGFLNAQFKFQDQHVLEVIYVIAYYMYHIYVS